VDNRLKVILIENAILKIDLDACQACALKDPDFGVTVPRE
jgi:hypothetical protein